MQRPRTPRAGGTGAHVSLGSGDTNPITATGRPHKSTTTAAPVYPTSLINRRTRSTKAEVEDRRAALLDIVVEHQPMTVRQLFYQATVLGLIEKTEAGYAKVQTDLVRLRRSGELPYGYLTDSTRYQRKPDSYQSIGHALEETASFYRRDLWAAADSYVEVWIEKDALSGVIYPITSEYDVPLMSARGYASLSFLHGAAEYIGELEVPAYIYHLGDYDPSGVDAANKIEETLCELAPDAEIYFKRVAVMPWQIQAWNLPTRPTKTTDSRAKSFGSHESVELDAIEPEMLRSLVRGCIEKHLDQARLKVLKAAEESERAILLKFAKRHKE
jgi:hypothetical protein